MKQRRHPLRRRTDQPMANQPMRNEPVTELLDDILYWTVCAVLAGYTVAIVAGVGGFIYVRWFA